MEASCSIPALLLLLFVVFLSLQTHTLTSLTVSTAESGDCPDDATPFLDEQSEDASVPHPDKPAFIDPEDEENPTGYTSLSGVHTGFFDDYQSDLAKWTHTKVFDYLGQFKAGQIACSVVKGDRALTIPETAKRYGLSTKVTSMDHLPEKEVVLQYEAKFDQGIAYGNAYVKLPAGQFDSASLKRAKFYSIMFGSDKCGSTDKVRFIFQSTNPVTGKIAEHPLRERPSVASTLTKRLICTLSSSGLMAYLSLTLTMSQRKTVILADKLYPPVQPQKEIDDRDDRKQG